METEISDEILQDFKQLKKTFYNKYLAMSSNQRAIKAAKEIAKKYKIKYSDILKTERPDNNLKGDKTWNKQGIAESRIMDFESFNLSEKRKPGEELSVPDTTPDIALLDLTDVVSGKLIPKEVSPSGGKDKTTFAFPQIEERESGDRNEEVEIYLPNDKSFFINFTWSYGFKAGKTGGYLDKDDPDEYTLDDFDLESVTYYYGKDGENELKMEITPKMQAMLKKYFEEFLPID